MTCSLVWYTQSAVALTISATHPTTPHSLSVSRSSGMQVWKSALQRGRLPVSSDGICWPPLTVSLVNAMVELQLPRLVQRHPVLLSTVLLSMVRWVREHEEDKGEEELDSLEISEEDYTFLGKEEEEDEDESLADVIADGLITEFGKVSTGAQLVDKLFGYHRQTCSIAGYGTSDGIWQHTGWKLLPHLLNQVSRMPELRQLLQSLGRRPAVEGPQRRLSRRRRASVGMEGPVADENGVAVTGLSLSSSLADMLPQEAVLLRSSSPTLRRLFHSKLADAKLQSYQRLSYHHDSATRSLAQQRTQQPSGSGGPLIVCLDTSHSMVSLEHISKAIVVACVAAAHRQGRTCRVVAFAAQQSVKALDATDLLQLLDWLSCSFVGGGTDVTGVLRSVLRDNGAASISTKDLSVADILLITDGELPPVVDTELFEQIQQHRDLEIHGLNLGSEPSAALDEICTETHDFCMDYRCRQLQGGWGRNSTPKTTPTSKTALFARRRKFDDWDTDYSPMDTTGGTVDAAVSEQPYWDKVEVALEQLRSSVSKETQKTLEKIDESVPGMEDGEHQSVLAKAIAVVTDNLVEREEEARLVVLGLVAGEHVLLLGPPGTAKSELGLRLSRLCGGSFFQRLLTRFTTPEELFGPLSLKALEEDVYMRKTSGFLPTADVAFLDEVFKANSAILNTLLTILNERQFDNGRREDCPIRCVIAASNELPDSGDLEALYDRFLIRKQVNPLSDDGLMEMLFLSNRHGQSIHESSTNHASDLSSAELDRVIRDVVTSAASVKMTKDVGVLIKELRQFILETFDATISDRRLMKAAWVLKVVATSSGRRRLDTIDAMILHHILWQEPEQQESIRTWLWDHATPAGDEISSYGVLLNSLRQEAMQHLRKTGGDATGLNGGNRKYIAELATVSKEVTKTQNVILLRLEALAHHRKCLEVAEKHLWVSHDEALAFKQLLLPKAQHTSTALAELLRRTSMLLVSLSGENSVVPIKDEVRVTVMEQLWDDAIEPFPSIPFTTEELSMTSKEAKRRLSEDDFRRWKRGKKRETQGRK